MEEVETTKGAQLLRALNRRLGRSSRPKNEDCRSSSTDSNSSNSHNSESSTMSPDTREISYSSSDTGSEESPERKRRHRSTTSSFRKVFQSLSISRSHSCSSGISDPDKSRSRSTKKNPQPKKILRPPVTYTYVRGLSGLPTQRVPIGRNPYATPRLVLSGLNR